jgi:hypothetical protein
LIAKKLYFHQNLNYQNFEFEDFCFNILVQKAPTSLVERNICANSCNEQSAVPKEIKML